MDDRERLARQVCIDQGGDPDGTFDVSYPTLTGRNDGLHTPSVQGSAKLANWQRYEAAAHAMLSHAKRAGLLSS